MVSPHTSLIYRQTSCATSSGIREPRPCQTNLITATQTENIKRCLTSQQLRYVHLIQMNLNTISSHSIRYIIRLNPRWPEDLAWRKVWLMYGAYYMLLINISKLSFQFSSDSIYIVSGYVIFMPLHASKLLKVLEIPIRKNSHSDPKPPGKFTWQLSLPSLMCYTLSFFPSPFSFQIVNYFLTFLYKSGISGYWHREDGHRTLWMGSFTRNVVIGWTRRREAALCWVSRDFSTEQP